MSATQANHEPFSSDYIAPYERSNSAGNSKTAVLIELARTFVAASSMAPIGGQCSRCRSYRDPRTSTSEYPNIFCSRQCELEFVHGALACLTLDDCIRVQQRLDNLLAAIPEPAV
jgi:hypothetical protein